MSPALRELLEAQRAAGCPGLAGSRVRVSVGVRDAAVNAALAARALPSAIESVHVVFDDGLRMLVRLAVRVFGFRKRIDLPLQLAPRADLTHGIQLEAAVGGPAFLVSTAARVAPFFGRLPAGISLDERGARVDLQPLLADHGLADLKGYIRDISLESGGGVLRVHLEAAAPARDDVPRPTAPARRAPAAAAARGDGPDPLTLVDSLDAEVTLRIADGLATALLSAIDPFQPRSEGSAPGLPAEAFAWKRPPQLRFEPGWAQLDAAVTRREDASAPEEGAVSGP